MLQKIITFIKTIKNFYLFTSGLQVLRIYRLFSAHACMVYTRFASIKRQIGEENILTNFYLTERYDYKMDLLKI